MSDAMTEMGREAHRGDLYGQYLGALVGYLEAPTKENKSKVLRAGESSDDSFPNRFLYRSVNGLIEVDEMLHKLVKKDKKVWAKLLYKICMENDFSGVFNRLKTLSPFADEVFVVVDYGTGFVSFKGELESMIAGFVKQKGWKVGDCDKYVLTFSQALTPSEVLWVSCGISGIDGPRPTQNR